MDVIDLHCDLLAYLANDPRRTPNDSQARCSLPQLKAGGVKTQVLAIFTETGRDSLSLGMRQLEIYKTLKGSFIPAFENASSFALEQEPLDVVFKRLEEILTTTTPLYISLTWNGENRFGGGCGAHCGLKPDGKELLAFLSGRGIALDFSHTSDPLANDLIDFLDKKNLEMPVLASHSNFRAIHNHIRNLPDPIAKEIINRGGRIGLVFYKEFLKNPDQLYDHICHGLELGGEGALCFGADFFCPDDFEKLSSFYDEMSDASKYPQILKRLHEQGLSKELLERIALHNAIPQKNATF